MVGGNSAACKRAVAFALVCSLFGARSLATTIVLADFDDTTVETRESFGGTFKTGFKLFRIEYRATTLQPVYNGPPVITVTPVDMHRIKRYLGEGPAKLGAINRRVNLEDGQVIVPGYYTIRSPDTFEYFMTAPAGENYLLRDFRLAEKRDPEGAFKGQFWDIMCRILASEKGAEALGFISARGHSLEEWRELFEYLKKRRYIENLPNFDLFHSISLPEYDQYSLRKDVPVQKVKVLEELARKLGRAPLGPRDTRLHPNGKEHAPYHYLVFADDKQETIDLAAKLFQSLARSQAVKVKFGLFNMGNRTEVQASQRPQFAIVEPDGTFRHATEDELVGEPEARREALIAAAEAAPTCSAKVAVHD